MGFRDEARAALKIAIGAAAISAAGGCTVSSGPGVSRSATYVGIVRVERPSTQGDLQALAVKVLGMGWDRGPFLGWRDSNWVIADPARCQMLVIVRSGVEAEHAATLFGTSKGENICVADFSGTLRSSQPASP